MPVTREQEHRCGMFVNWGPSARQKGSLKVCSSMNSNNQEKVNTVMASRYRWDTGMEVLCSKHR
jgi:hypothetical protein